MTNVSERVRGRPAVAFAPEGPLKGSAFASIGSAAALVGDHTTAIKAFSSAAKNNFRPKWVMDDYDAMFAQREGVGVASLAKNYQPIGRTPGLSTDELDKLKDTHWLAQNKLPTDLLNPYLPLTPDGRL